MKTRKAIAPVVATILLIIIAIAGALVVYSYLANTTSSYSKGGEIEAKITGTQVASGEIFLNIWVKNVGPVNINITDAKIDNTIAVSDLIGKTLASGNEISIVTTISNLSTGKHILTITFDDGTGEKTRMFPFSI